MRKTSAVVVVAIVLVWSVSGQQRTVQRSPIQGVWRAVEQTINERTLKDTQIGVGYHIYTDRFFAVVRETGTPPRPNVGNADEATVAQLMAGWGPFVAQIGTYETSGDQLSSVILVAKNPDATGRKGVERFTLTGNTLTLEPAEPVPAGARSIRMRLVRVE